MNYPQRFALNDKVDIVLDTYKGRCLEATSLILFEDSLLWTEKALVSSNIDQDDNNMINDSLRIACCRDRNQVKKNAINEIDSNNDNYNNNDEGDDDALRDNDDTVENMIKLSKLFTTDENVKEQRESLELAKTLHAPNYENCLKNMKEYTKIMKKKKKKKKVFASVDIMAKCLGILNGNQVSLCILSCHMKDQGGSKITTSVSYFMIPIVEDIHVQLLSEFYFI